MTVRALTFFAAAAITACGNTLPAPDASPVRRTDVSVVAAVDTQLPATQDADGVAAPIQQAVVATKLMGTVTEVLVHEGDRVTAGQPVVRIDARDVEAKGAQASAAVAAAEAAQGSAALQLKRLKALFADSAAPRAMLDAAETGFAQADAALRAARAAATEVASVRDYAVVRAPFAGTVTKRFVDVGAFAAPGAPLIQIQDLSRLRLTVTAPPAAARRAVRGATLDASVDGVAVRAVVEGVVPSSAGGVYTINALVTDPRSALAAGGAASLALPGEVRPALVVPSSALIRDGDLIGVRVRTSQGDDLRWIKIGRTFGRVTEVVAGLRAGEQVLIPRSAVK
jgi:RND family efflux transporter MFP subunit